MKVLGIDIGTTTISVSLIDGLSGKVVRSVTENSDSFLPNEKAFQKEQSVQIIEAKVHSLLSEMKNSTDPISAIGLTGQMHGIVYVNKEGEAVSPLYTWQDGRANEKYWAERTYSDELFFLTGYKVPAGYGLATHFYNIKNALVPQEASSLCTIHDYIAMRLCHNKQPKMHVSNAASLGLFDLENGCFDLKAMAQVGIDASFLPVVFNRAETIGFYQNIPVSIAIGDNQASYLGSVSNAERSVLINIGTGSQISVIGSLNNHFPSGEVRPFNGTDYLLVGSALCGGRSYAMLEKFFREIFVAYNGDTSKTYEYMNKLAQQSYPVQNGLKVDTSFSGTRTNPSQRGRIDNIDTENFLPGNLIVGFLKGAVIELLEMYREIEGQLVTKPSVLIGSGNGIRKCAIWRKICEDLFEMRLQIPAHTEEAAYGAAIFALGAVGAYSSVEEAQKIINYLG